METINIEFRSWGPPLEQGGRLRQLISTWDKTFILSQDREKTKELATGYLYALTLIIAHYEKTNNIFSVVTRHQLPNGKVDVTNAPFKLSFVRESRIGTAVLPPRVEEPLDKYMARAGIRRPQKKYIIVVSLDDNQNRAVDVLQFDNLEFLQGFLSVLKGFNQPAIQYIVTIYDNNGVEYTVR